MQTCHFLFFEHALVLDGHHLDEVLDIAVPVVKHASCEGRTRMKIVLTDEFKEFLARYGVLDQRELYHIHIAEIVKRMVGVINVGHTATHTRSKVTTRFAQYHHATARHILATMVAGTLDDRRGSRVAHAKTLTYHSVDIELTRGGTIETGITSYNILFGFEVIAATSRRQNRDATTRKTLAEVVITLTFKFDVESLYGKGTKALTCRAFELDINGIIRQARFTVFLGDNT